MGRIPSWAIALSTGCLLLGLVPSPAHAALVPVGKAKVAKLSSGGDHVVHGDVAVSADGTRALAAWTVSAYDAGTMTTTFTLKAAAAAIKGGTATWGSATALVSGSVSDIEAVALDLSADGTRGLVAWSRDKDGLSTYVIEGRAATINGTSGAASWSPLAEVSDDVDDNQHPVVDVTASGARALIAWRHISDAAWSVHVATVGSVGAAATWGDAKAVFTGAVADPASDYLADLTVGLADDGGAATLGWIRTWAAEERRAQSVSGTVTATSSSWGTVTTLATGAGITTFDLDVSSSAHRASAIWAVDGVCGECVVSASADVAGTSATWGTAGQVSAPGEAALLPEIEVSADGSRAITLWMGRGTGAFLTSDGTYLRPVSAVATIANRSATWGLAAFVSEDEVPTLDSRLAISADGTRGIVSWMSYNPSGVTPVLKPFLSSFTVSGTEISPVNQRSLGKFPSILSATNLRLASSADSTTALALWIVDVDNTADEPDIAQTGVVTFTVDLDPSIGEVSPAKGPVTGGTEVTITGSNFVDVEDVSFGFDSADDFTVESDSQITAVVPEGDRLGKVSITITTAAGEVTRKNAFEFIKGPLPRITKLTPAVGGLTVEDEITITGAHFFAPEVRIGGKEADMVEYVSSSEIIVRIPVATKLGAVDVSVKTLSGTTVRSDGFTYVIVPAKPTGVSVEADGDDLIVRWGRLRSSQVAIEVTCTNKTDGSEVTAQVGKNSTSASIDGVDSGTYTCVVQGVGRGGAMGMPSLSRRLTVQ